MKHARPVISLLNRIVVFFLISVFLFSCDDESEKQGPGEVPGSFNRVLDGISSSLAYSAFVSSDGSKILVSTQSNNTGFYYSSNGGGEFNRTSDNIYISETIGIDNLGNFLLRNNRVFRNGAVESLGTFDEVILGDNGKVFSYHTNSGTLKYKNISDASFTTITMPITPTPGSGGSTYYPLKAAGKGFLFIAVSGTDTRTVNAFLLDEANLTWTSQTISFQRNSINTCSNPSRFERYQYVGDNKVLLKGCSGMALLDLTAGTSTSINYPEIESMILEDARDGASFRDAQGRIYLSLGSYVNLTEKPLYRYDGTSWEKMDEYVNSGTTLFAADATGNIFYNRKNAGGTIINGFTKENSSTGSKTTLDLPSEPIPVFDAVAINDNELLIVAERELYRYNAGALVHYPLTDVTHVNILSDGRWLAGGANRIYISTNEGTSWTESKDLFSSIDPELSMAAVRKSRIIDGKLILVGVHAYTYYNQSLGVEQDKYKNIVVEFNGTTAAKLDYGFPNDMFPTALSPSGTLFGYALFVSEFGMSRDHYQIDPGMAPVMLKKSVGLSPMVITDSNVQMTVNNTASGIGFEIVTRNSSTEEWKSTTSLPASTGSYEGLYLTQAAGRTVFVNRTEVYVSAD